MQRYNRYTLAAEENLQMAIDPPADDEEKLKRKDSQVKQAVTLEDSRGEEIQRAAE